jgi:tetratricopeptide (TPR) repeat protein
VTVSLADPVRRFVAELARRRVFYVVALYGGGAFALLESVDIVVGSLGLSPRITTILTIVVLLGFPVAVGIGWLYDLDASGYLRPTAGGGVLDGSPGPAAGKSVPVVHLGLAGLVGVGLVALVSWVIAVRVLPPDPRGYAVPDPRGSYLVTSVRGGGQEPAELALAGRAASRLMWALRGWDSLRVVQEFALTGMLYDLEVPRGQAPDLHQAYQMARNQGVGTVMAVHVGLDRDTAFLEAALYDVAEEREVGQPVLFRGVAADLDGLVAPVTRTILNLRDQTVELAELRGESPNLRAHQDFFGGLEALYGWRLTEAESLFRAAIAEDSIFAAAHHYLALTLYWQTARDGERLTTAGPEIARLTQSASRLADQRNLRPGLRDHVEALRSFWAGDYEEARRIVRSLIDRDPSDTEAWLLLGSIEFTDPYTEVTTGGLRPRRSPNEARHAFERSVELSPDFQLSYGHLFALDRELLDAVSGLGCPAFEPPEAPRRPPFVAPEAGGQVPFCPLVTDSVEWVPAADFALVDLKAATRRAEARMRRSRALLEEWVQIHPNEARPHQELDRWLTWKRGALGCETRPEEVAELTRAIGRHREAAFALSSDTTPEDRARLALLRLADGRVEAALDALGGDPPVSSASSRTLPAANVHLAVGRTRDALTAAAPAYDGKSWGRLDPDGGGVIQSGPVADLVREAAMRGATGSTGAELRGAYERLLASWSGPDYTRRESVLLREMLLRMELAPGLLIDSVARAAWFAGWDDEGIVIPVLWRGLLAGDRLQAERALATVLETRRAWEITGAFDHFAVGVLARHAGNDSLAAASFREVVACPLSLDDLDVGWGLRTLSILYLSRSLEAVGDPAASARALNVFSDLWRGRPEGPGDPARR